MAIIYKKLGALDRTLLHFNIALKIRKQSIGLICLPVSNILEQLGKFYIETGYLKESYGCLSECYLIRKKLVGVEVSETKRISMLMLYLHKRIE